LLGCSVVGIGSAGILADGRGLWLRLRLRLRLRLLLGLRSAGILAGGRGRLWQRRCGRRRAGLSLRRDPRHYAVHADGLPFLRQDLGQRAGGGGGDLGVDFVSGDLQERFVALDFLARSLHPADDGALRDRFAHLGHDDVNGH
jgi:hypothetical protein